MEEVLDRAVRALAMPGRWWRFLLLFSLLQTALLLIQTWPPDQEAWLWILLFPAAGWLFADPLNRLFDRVARFLGGESHLIMIRALTIAFMPLGLIVQLLTAWLPLVSMPDWFIAGIDKLIGLLVFILYIRAVCRLYNFSFGRFLLTQIITAYLILGAIMCLMIPLIFFSEWLGWPS
jgi:hypothetical protein